MKWRLVMIALVALALAPGTFVRTPMGEPDLRPILRMAPLAHDPRSFDGFEIEGVWHLTSPNDLFGGFSGLAATGADELLAVSDKGSWMRFGVPGSGTGAVFGELDRARLGDKRQVDAEAATLDATSRRVWIAYEGTNTIERSGYDLKGAQRAKPAGMKDWPINGGAETLTRLAGGRFLAIGEGRASLGEEGYPALLFDGDPVAGAEATSFRFAAPDGFRATDAHALPDGRVLILMRSIEGYLPPRFGAKLAIADPAEIRAGEIWRAEVLATFPASLPSDNFEGLAVQQREGGGLTLWIMSDDNGASFQRTLLYKLRWDPDATRESAKKDG